MNITMIKLTILSVSEKYVHVETAVFNLFYFRKLVENVMKLDKKPHINSTIKFVIFSIFFTFKVISFITYLSFNLFFEGSTSN